MQVEGTNAPVFEEQVQVSQQDQANVARETPKEDKLAELERTVKEQRARKSNQKNASFLQKEVEALRRQLQERDSMLEEFDKDPTSFLTKRGKKIDDLVDASLDRPVEDPVRNEMETLKQKIERLENEKQEYETNKAYEGYISDIKKKTEELGEGADLVKHFGAYEYVYEAMDQHYRQNVEKYKDPQLAMEAMLPMESYIEATEGMLEEQYLKAKDSSKLKRHFGVSAAQAPKQTTTTLNNRAASVPSPIKDSSDLTREERDAQSTAILRAARQRLSM